MCMGEHVFSSVYAYVGQTTLGAILQIPPTFSRAGQGDSSSPVLGLQACTTMPDCLIWLLGLKFKPQSLPASTSLTEPFPQPFYCVFPGQSLGEIFIALNVKTTELKWLAAAGTRRAQSLLAASALFLLKEHKPELTICGTNSSPASCFPLFSGE